MQIIQEIYRFCLHRSRPVIGPSYVRYAEKEWQRPKPIAFLHRKIILFLFLASYESLFLFPLPFSLPDAGGLPAVKWFDNLQEYTYNENHNFIFLQRRCLPSGETALFFPFLPMAKAPSRIGGEVRFFTISEETTAPQGMRRFFV